VAGCRRRLAGGFVAPRPRNLAGFIDTH
jgi:hypothetical protein